jgi:signal transduction histidine kinase
MKSSNKRHSLSSLPVHESDSSLSSDFFDELPQWKYSSWKSCLGLSGEDKMYQEFMAKENSWAVHVALTIFGSIGTLVTVLGASLGSFSTEFKMYTCQRIFMLIPMWLHFYSIVQKKYPGFRPLPIDIIYLGDTFLLSYSVSFGVYMYGMATAEGCDSTSPPPLLMCDNHIKIETAMAYVVLSMTLSVLIKCRHMGVVILCIVIEFSFLSAVVYIVEPSPQNAIAVVAVIIANIVVAFDCDIYSRRLYLLLVESHSFMRDKIMSDNVKVVMEMQSTELRFLIGNVAHDLKTPLQAFSYELEIMKDQSAAPSNRESILLLESICSFMLMTINRAIDYTKVKSGIKLKPSMETVDVGRVLDWVQMCVAHTVTSFSVSIVVEPFPADICNCIITDKQWLMENLLCLISNAQKFTARGIIRIKYSFAESTTTAIEEEEGEEEGEEGAQEGGQSMSREVFSAGLESERTDCVDSSGGRQESRGASESRHPMVMVEVVDDGIGISEEMQQTLFQPFKQAMRRAGGTGLGIYSLSKRVESLGGACGVSSRLDGKSGARFWFTLPYRPDYTVAASLGRTSPPATSKTMSLSTLPTPASLSTSSASSSNVSSSATSSGQDRAADGIAPTEALKTSRIMLVEDSPLIQKTCARSFLREGITVDIANNGLECVEKVLKAPNQYTVLLMDVNMPLMDGLEATERIRQWERGSNSGDGLPRDLESNVPAGVGSRKLLIIGVSANSDSQSAQEALDAGMDRFISKPLKMSVFRDCITEFGLEFDEFICL